MNGISSQKLKARRPESEAAAKVLHRLAAALESGRRVDPALWQAASQYLRAGAGPRARGGAGRGRRGAASQETELALADVIPGLSEALREAGRTRGKGGRGLDYAGRGFRICLTPPPLSDRNYTD